MTIARSPGRDLYALEGDRRVLLGPATSGLLTVLKLIRHGEVEEGDLATPSARLGALTGLVTRLRAGGWLSTAVEADGTPLAEVRTFGPVVQPDWAAPLALSRFASVRRDGEDMLLESAAVAAEARLRGGTVGSVLFELARPGDVRALAAGSDTREAVIRVLGRSGLLVNVPGPEDEEFRFRQWSSHEALFHARSRWGVLNGTVSVGPSTWADGRFEPLPARRPASAGRRIALDRPATPAGQDFFDVLERRRSVRFYDAEQPLDIRRLSEFLYRAARVRSTFDYESVEYSDRPYPSGGGAHELEVYIAAVQVRGLSPGLYRYDPFDHELETVAAAPETAAAFAAAAARATTLPVPPQAVVVLSARFGRLLGRYRAMGYATVLKNVGVLYQTMYLVATALDLAPCALGNGDMDLFAAASGLDRWEEASVGEFALGGRPAQAESAVSKR